MSKEYRQAWSKIFTLIRSGASWSGHERNCAYLNTGKGRFANISVTSGFDFAEDGRCLVTTDWDHDGDLDVWISNRNAPRIRFLRNNLPRGNHFLQLRLVGNGTTTNRDAIGARVILLPDDVESTSGVPSEATGTQDPVLQKTLRAGEGFLSQSSKWLYFGLGDLKLNSTAVVLWPGGEREVFAQLAPDSRLTLVQGKGVAEPVILPPRDTSLTQKDQEPKSFTEQATLRMVTPMDLPTMSYTNWDGVEQQLETNKGKPILVNLWASWCGPCLVELHEFVERRLEIESAGIEIISLSVDGLANEKSTPDDARNLLSSLQYPFSSGRATTSLIDALQTLHDMQTPVRRALPLPNSFLIDSRGRLIAIYKGPVEVDDLIRFVSTHAESPAERFQRAAVLSGHTVDDKATIASIAASDALHYFKFSGFYHELGRQRLATQQLEKVVNLWPNAEAIRIRIGSSLFQQGKLERAKAHLDQAVLLNPKSSSAHAVLAHLMLQQRDMQAVVKHSNKALALDPNNHQVRFSRGMANDALGQTAEAIEDFNQVTTLAPDFTPAFLRRGDLYLELKEFELAQQDFQDAIRLNPQDARGYNNLAWLQATCPKSTIRDGTKAIANATKACELLKWNSLNAIDTLAAAYAESGDFKEAVRWQTKAIELAPQGSKAPLSVRLKSYQAAKPYRHTPSS